MVGFRSVQTPAMRADGVFKEVQSSRSSRLLSSCASKVGNSARNVKITRRIMTESHLLYGGFTRVVGEIEKGAVTAAVLVKAGQPTDPAPRVRGITTPLFGDRQWYYMVCLRRLRETKIDIAYGGQ